MVKVLIVDDNALDRDGLKYSLIDEPDIELVGEASNGIEAVDMAQELKPDVVLMDLRMPLMGGVDATKKITEMEPTPKVIALSTYDTDRYVGPAMEAGATAHIRKDAPAPDLLRLVRGPGYKPPGKKPAASASSRTSLPGITREKKDVSERGARRAGHFDAPRPGSDIFSDVELDVLTNAAKGMTNSQIAAKLAIDQAEVRQHLHKLYKELRVKDRSGLRSAARRRRLLP